VKADVVLAMVDESAEEVEVVPSSMHADEDNTVFSAEGEDGGGRKAIATEVGMLIHVPEMVVVVERGEDGGWSSTAMVLILVGCDSKSASSSGAWRSSESTHESWAGE